jgi:hypothetical protein
MVVARPCIPRHAPPAGREQRSDVRSRDVRPEPVLREPLSVEAQFEGVRSWAGHDATLVMVNVCHVGTDPEVQRRRRP